MYIWLYLIISVLIIILIFFLLKMFFIKKSIKEIRINLIRILKSDTNNLLTIDTKNKEIVQI